MNRSLLIIILCIFFACNKQHQTIHYEYNGVRINRLNKGDKTYFSSGYSNDEQEIIKNASIVVDYSFDHFLFIFLLFHQNGTVEIISGGGGNITILKKSPLIFFKDSRPATNLDSFRNSNYNNLYQISDNLELEKNRNKSFGSNVQIVP